MFSADRLRNVANAAVTGVIVCAWYALPDHLPRRGERVPAKIGLLLGGLALSAVLNRSSDGPEVHDEVAERGSGRHEDVTERDEDAGGVREGAAAVTFAVGNGTTVPDTREDTATSGPAADDAPTSGLAGALGRLSPAAVVGVVGGVLALTTVATVMQERLLHRLGERLGRRGVSSPHTKVGLALGAVAALSTAVRPAGEGPIPSTPDTSEPRGA
ncbi:hypothetical protein [Georgenia sp. Z1491]|uniref:hypothetical protein n=1 Tax=Georgenia sp. Z1491 TaxID=3416707 RepID=UPI003CE9A2EA